MSQQVPINAPLTAEQVGHAWKRAFEPSVADHARALGVLLDGLPLVAAGQLHEDGREVTLRAVVERVLAHDQPGRWRLPGPAGGEGRPFLIELARRVLVLGHLSGAYPDEDPLLHPYRTRIDVDCADAGLALARALTAVELQNAALVVLIASRHLIARARDPEAGRPQSCLAWLAPLLEDVAAQCLLVSALACSRVGAEQLFRHLVGQYDECRRARTPWPEGPLTTACALGLLLRSPRELGHLEDLKERVRGWPGWADAEAWPTRLPGAGLDDVKARLTEHVAGFLGLGDRRLWPRRGLERLLEGCWPPLLSFCFSAPEPQRAEART